ncbi:MAG: hypothetical protein WBD31_30855 [Rubripirellula sp.]
MPKSRRASSWIKQFNRIEGFDPFDDSMAGANGMEFRNNPGTIEGLYLKRGKLIAVNSSIGDHLIAEWEYDYFDNYKLVKSTEFDPAYEMMPIRVSDRVPGRPVDFWEMRTRWKKFGKHLLPSKIETACGDIDNGSSRKRMLATQQLRYLDGEYRFAWRQGESIELGSHLLLCSSIPTSREVVRFLSHCFLSVHYSPSGESLSVSEERAECWPPLADARPSLKRRVK